MAMNPESMFEKRFSHFRIISASLFGSLKIKKEQKEDMLE